MTPNVTLWVGGDAVSVQRRRCHLTGPRMFSGAYGPKSRFPASLVPQVEGILDSGAYSDLRTGLRLPSPAACLARQLAWERNASRLWGVPWQAAALVSHDLLIDEKWTGKVRKKQRWSVREADRAVAVTIDAAAYLARQRDQLAPRGFVLACQGVDTGQYAECVAGVLAHALPADTIGLGGWCILGMCRTWIPVAWQTWRRILPAIARAGIRSVHLFGVLFRPVLGGLLWLCDQHGLALSTDSSAPILAPCFPDQARSGALAPLWEDNVRLWQEALATLRTSPFYREPPDPKVSRQLELWDAEVCCVQHPPCS